MTKKMPQKTITRALLYIRTLSQWIQDKNETISSERLAHLTGLTDVQVRKDISFFGRVGIPRVGYRSQELKKKLEDIVAQEVVHIALFGVGHLGRAILCYPGFHQEKTKIVAAFDIDRQKVGQVINGVRIHGLKNASKIVKRVHADIGVIAVPKECSQTVADLIARCGLRGIVNFSPVTVSVPRNVVVRNIDLSIEFLALFCDIQR